MATDTRRGKSLTLAELCQAIADGILPYVLRDNTYYVKPSDVRRMCSDNSARMDDTSWPDPIEPGREVASLNAGCSA